MRAASSHILFWSLLVGCASNDVPSPSHPPAPRPTGDASADHAVTEPALAMPASVEIAAPAGAAFTSSTPELARFHAALNELERKQRTDHVRVLWLGDSHGQADFWSGQLRKQLGERFGRGGPGFIHLGYKNYRHDGIKLDVHGKWRMRPKKPVAPKRQGDGVYGLGGLMMSGYDDMPRVELALSEPILGDHVRYDVCYRFTNASDAIAISIDDKPEVTVRPESGDLGVVKHLGLVASTQGPFVIRPIGRTDLCGVVVESDPQKNPGVVVDTLAINGARYGTALAWEEASWTAEVARRKPQLVVLEYGTNEAGDTTPAYTKVSKQVGELMTRIRKVAPDVDCVVVSPTDRADAGERVTEMRKNIMAAAKKEGCYWFDAWELLGGEGAAEKLSEEAEPRMSKDKIHLTIRGYRKLGTTMFESLVSGYPRSGSLTSR